MDAMWAFLTALVTSAGGLALLFFQNRKQGNQVTELHDKLGNGFTEELFDTLTEIRVATAANTVLLGQHEKRLERVEERVL